MGHFACLRQKWGLEPPWNTLETSPTSRNFPILDDFGCENSFIWKLLGKTLDVLGCTWGCFRRATLSDIFYVINHVYYYGSCPCFFIFWTPHNLTFSWDQGLVSSILQYHHGSPADDVGVLLQFKPGLCTKYHQISSYIIIYQRHMMDYQRPLMAFTPHWLKGSLGHAAMLPIKAERITDPGGLEGMVLNGDVP